MKKVTLMVSVLACVIVSILVAQDRQTASTTINHAIVGGWERRGFSYVFDSTGVMKAVKITGVPIGFRQYTYSIFKMGINEFIEYRGESDSTSLNVLLINDVRDSTAIIAYGTSFVRADSSEGMIGTWKRVEGFTTMIWSIKPQNIRYRETVYDIASGSTRIIENRGGTYSREPEVMNADAKALSGGRYNIRFDDGRRAMVLPIIYKKLMYLFDLSPAKALFVRVNPDSVPSYRDYQAELDKRQTTEKRTENTH